MRSSVLSLVGVVIVTCSACGSTSSPAASPTEDGGAGDAGGETVDAGEVEAPPLHVKLTNETLAVDARKREYTLAVPLTYDEQKQYPLVVLFHGDGGNGPGMRKAITLDDVSAEEAIVAYPSGLDAAWDITTPLATNPDMKFIQELVKALSAKYKVDPARVFGVGYSKGAFFINMMACRMTGFFRGLVSFEGGAPDEEFGDPAASTWPSGATKCAGQTGGIAAMIVQGDADTVVTPDSGDYNAMYWAGINGCQETRVDTKPPPCKKYEGCPVDKPVTYCLIPKLNHYVWPEGAKEGWAFMKAL